MGNFTLRKNILESGDPMNEKKKDHWNWIFHSDSATPRSAKIIRFANFKLFNFIFVYICFLFLLTLLAMYFNPAQNMFCSRRIPKAPLLLLMLFINIDIHL